MPLPSHLLRDLRQALGSFRAANGISAVPNGSGKALEAWLLLKLAKSANTLPSWRATLRKGDATRLSPGNTFQFQAGQSGINTSSSRAPGFVLLEHRTIRDLSVELHGGLQWRGRSGATHECDVSAVPAAIAGAIRSNGGGVPRGLPVAAFECKDKTSKGTADEMRQTLARLFDLALVTQPQPGWSCRIWEENANTQWGRRSSRYVSFFAKGSFGVVRVGSFQSGARRLGRHYHIRRFGSIYDPSNSSIKLITSDFRGTLTRIRSF